MTFHFRAGAFAADLKHVLVEQALVQMLADDQAGAPKLPAPFSSTSRTMFVCLPENTSRLTLDLLADHHDVGVVLGVMGASDALTPIRFDLGVKLHWKVLWHDSFLLWQAPDEQVLFVPESLDGNLRFWIDKGELLCDNGLPFANRADREAGLEAASRRLAALVGER